MSTLAFAIGLIALAIVVVYCATSGCLGVAGALPAAILLVVAVAIGLACARLIPRKGYASSVVCVAFVGGFVGCMMVRVLMWVVGVGTLNFFGGSFFAMI